MKISIKKIFCLAAVILMVFSLNASALKMTREAKTEQTLNNTVNLENIKIFQEFGEDLDPLVDLRLTVTIKEIRAFDKIDRFSDPDFYVKLIVNGQTFTSDVWHNQAVVTDEWEKTINIPDQDEYVDVTIQLWDWNKLQDKICDIAYNNNEDPDRHDLQLSYSLKTGHWYGDDSTEGMDSWSPDYSGYGRGNGCDDNSIYEQDMDCEILFDITQNDFDGDGIPYWTEVNKYGTDPEVDDRGLDDDEDLVPIEWEHKWGHYLTYDHHNHTYGHAWFYDPFRYENHEELDPDGDSLTNYEEYLTSEWGSNPFRKDIFVELDQMEAGPNGEPASILPEGTKEIIKKAFNRQNIVFHLDDGCMGGLDTIPFDTTGDNTTRDELDQMYYDYFLHGDEDNWRKGVFHYGLVVYNATFPGFVFRSDGYQVSTKGMESKAEQILTGSREIVYATAYMHELGHTLGLNHLFGHSTDGYSIWQILWWQARPYKSIMNYGYMYGIFHPNFCDYSDGHRGKNDFDDWSNINFSNFE